MYYLDGSYELRDSQHATGIQKHIKLGNLRVARIELPQLQAQTQLAKHTLSFNPGWNPVFLQVGPQGNNIYSQLGDILPKVQEVIGFNAEQQSYQRYQRDRSAAGQLSQLSGQQAYWFKVDALEFFDWSIENQQSSDELQQAQVLKPGWNWRKLPLSKAVSVADFVKKHPTVSAIWYLDPSKSATQERWQLWLKGEDTLNTLQQLTPDTLYWLASSQELPLTDPNDGIQGSQFNLHNDHLGSVILTLDHQNQIVQHSPSTVCPKLASLMGMRPTCNFLLFSRMALAVKNAMIPAYCILKHVITIR